MRSGRDDEGDEWQTRSPSLSRSGSIWPHLAEAPSPAQNEHCVATVVSEFQQPTAPIPPQNRPNRSREFVSTCEIGAPGVTRTPGTQFRKLLLYPPELRGRRT